VRIAIAQLDFTTAAFDRNLDAMRQAVDRSRAAGAQLIVFSELATIGYPPGDLLERDDIVDRNLVQLERIAALSDETLAILVGYVERNPLRSGRRCTTRRRCASGDGSPTATSSACCRPTTSSTRRATSSPGSRRGCSRSTASASASRCARTCGPTRTATASASTTATRWPSWSTAAPSS